MNDEAIAIAKHMSHLKHLELAYGLLTDSGMEAILSMCKEFEHLDIRGCWALAMKDDLVQQCHQLKYFTGPDLHYSFFDDTEEYLSYNDDYDVPSMSIHDYDYYERLFEQNSSGSDEMYLGEDSNGSDDERLFNESSSGSDEMYLEDYSNGSDNGWDDFSRLGAYANVTDEDMDLATPGFKSP